MKTTINNHVVEKHTVDSEEDELWSCVNCTLSARSKEKMKQKTNNQDCALSHRDTVSETTVKEERTRKADKLSITGGIVYDDSEIQELSDAVKNALTETTTSISIRRISLDDRDHVEGFRHQKFTILISRVALTTKSDTPVNQIVRERLREFLSKEPARIVNINEPVA